MSNNLANLFGVDALKETLPEKQIEDLGLDKDSEESRANLKVLLDTGSRALEEVLNLAIDSENPRAYEVLTNMITTLADINIKLIETHNKQADVKKKTLTNKNDTTPVVNGNITNQSIVFSGTTAELSNFLKDLNTQPIEEVKEIKNDETKSS